MLHPVQWLRQRLCTSMLASLKFDRKIVSADGTVLKRVRLVLIGYKWLLVPLFQIQYLESFSFPYHKRLEELFCELTTCFKNASELLSKSIIVYFSANLQAMLARFQECAVADMRPRYAVFHAAFVTKTLQKIVHGYRRVLLETLQRSSAEMIKSIVHKHLAMLFIKMKQDMGAIHAIPTMNREPLPEHTRFCVYGAGDGVFVIEEPPQVHTITYGYQTGMIERFTLAFPFVVFVLGVKQNKVAKLYAFFRNEPLNSITDSLGCPALSNVSDEDFGVCFPKPGIQAHPHVIAARALQNFWGSTFNDDWSSMLRQAMEVIPEIGSFRNWAAHTAKDSLFVLSLPWQPAKWRLDQAVNVMARVIGEGVLGQGLFTSAERHLESIAERAGEEVAEACLAIVAGHDTQNEDDVKNISTELEKMIAAHCDELEKTFCGEMAEVCSAREVEKGLGESVAGFLGDASEKLRSATEALPTLSLR